MAYNQLLANRIREQLQELEYLEEKKCLVVCVSFSRIKCLWE